MPREMKTLPTNRLAAIRKRQGMTQQQVADAVGSHWITISRLERGEIRLTDQWIDKLSVALQVDAHELYPADRTLVTVGVAGEIFPGGVVSPYSDDDPHTLTIHSALLQSPATKWYYVNTDALQPIFRDDDALCFMATDDAPDNFHGRYCLIWLAGSEHPIVGQIWVRKDRRVDVLVPGGEPIEDADIADLAPLAIAFYAVGSDITGLGKKE